MAQGRLIRESMYGELALFSGRANPELAQEIAAYLKVPLREAEVFEFPNENTYVRLRKSIRSHDVFLLQTVCPPVNQNLMELLIFIDTLKRDSAGRITAVMPYLAYARSDKKHEPRVPITARLVADLITAAGADRWMTIDLHAGQIQGFFSIPGDELTAFHLLSDYFLRKKLDNAVIVSGDLGFAKRGRNFAAKLGLPMAFVEKRRRDEGVEAEAFNVIGDVKGKHVIVVDDEVATAGTVVEAVDIVKEHGARDIYLSFTHPILVPPAAERLRELPIVEIVTTNTVPIPPQKRLPNLRVLSVAPLLGEVIRRVHLGLSVGEMFNE